MKSFRNEMSSSHNGGYVPLGGPQDRHFLVSLAKSQVALMAMLNPWLRSGWWSQPISKHWPIGVENSDSNQTNVMNPPWKHLFTDPLRTTCGCDWEYLKFHEVFLVWPVMISPFTERHVTPSSSWMVCLPEPPLTSPNSPRPLTESTQHTSCIQASPSAANAPSLVCEAMCLSMAHAICSWNGEWRPWSGRKLTRLRVTDNIKIYQNHYQK